ncbi:fucolectin-1-like [Ostrea edulis]|uniref:fucolectin-1-like n=1 Tax=Ostrea edulis TaxID=37623 RepID=UPI0024AF174A|nr:fucolectin-1-like [Ostrea edulis]
MSTILHPSKPDYVVDGRIVLDGHAGQCSHTQGETNPWITVDLVTIYVVQYVTLFNRIDDHGDRLRNVFVTLGDTGTQFPVECGQFKGPGVDAEVVHIICPNNARGRFVKTEIKGQTPYEVVTLCEIRVLTSP